MDGSLAAAGAGLSGVFGSAALHGALILGGAALAVTTGFDYSAVAKAVVTPFLSPL